MTYFSLSKFMEAFLSQGRSFGSAFFFASRGRLRDPLLVTVLSSSSSLLPLVVVALGTTEGSGLTPGSGLTTSRSKLTSILPSSYLVVILVCSH
jgi:hypothetical protein